MNRLGPSHQPIQCDSISTLHTLASTLLTDPTEITAKMSTENVLLFGLGGIGGVYASILHLSEKCNVHVVARSNYQSVKEKGFRLKSPIFGDHASLKFADGES